MSGDPATRQRLVIAQAQQGISKVHDLHKYDDEKRDALTLWEACLRETVG